MNDSRRMKPVVTKIAAMATTAASTSFLLAFIILVHQSILSAGFIITTKTTAHVHTHTRRIHHQSPSIANIKNHIAVVETSAGYSTTTKLFVYETEIAISTVAFASSHIGLSAIRRSLIDKIGDFANDCGWVGTSLTLPDIWPGDEAGQEIFPTSEIAGRQLYRIFYTIVSFATLGSAFGYYLASLAEASVATAAAAADSFSSITSTTQILQDPQNTNVAIYYVIASLAGGISIASLINPSPLSLVPVYEQIDTNSSRSSNDSAKTTTTRLLVRNDSKKLQPYGLTRITRHPLILPVVPWGYATSMIMGSHARDIWFFGGLAMYAIAGCAAQDLRVMKEEGSVGTVFNPQESSIQEFFRETSFVPFKALIESRQSMSDVVKEVPWVGLVVGTIMAYQIEKAFIAFLVNR